MTRKKSTTPKTIKVPNTTHALILKVLQEREQVMANINSQIDAIVAEAAKEVGAGEGYRYSLEEQAFIEAGDELHAVLNGES